MPGQVRRILIGGIVAHNVSPDHGILIAGLPGHPIEDVTLSNLQFHYLGGGTAEQSTRAVPEFEKAYPDPHVFGVMPSWGVFARHVKNLRLHDIELRVLSDDQRPAVMLDDVANIRCSDVQLTGLGKAPLWSMTGVSEMTVHDCTSLPPEKLPTITSRQTF